MVRITSELIENAPQFTNAIKDRELDLHGYKFPAIENLGGTLDQFDTIDFSDNEVRKLDGFPLLKRLKNLILTNNKVARIGSDLGQQLPNLTTLILSGNSLTDLKDLDSLSSCDKLEFLSLLHCPVTLRANYRLYVISRVPSLRFLDYRRVTQAERKLANTMFRKLPTLANTTTKTNGPKVVNNISRSDVGTPLKTFVPGAPINTPSNPLPPGTENALLETGVTVDTKENSMLSSEELNSSEFNATRPTPAPPVSSTVGTGSKRPSGATNQDLFAIQEAIKRARTMDEVERLHQLLSSGQFAGFATQWQRQLRQQQQQQVQQKSG